MRDILQRRNQALLHDVRLAQQALIAASIPPELEPYRNRLLELCRLVDQAVGRNLAFLALMRDDILEDIFSQTQGVMRLVRLLSAQLVIPVLRAATSDRLCLRTIGWLHRTHPETARYPAAFGDGPFGVRPFKDFVPIYFFPCFEQHGLLYQPLLFHEFGHLLYVLHSHEMNDLVADLQRDVQDVLLPASQRNDRHAAQQSSRRQEIANTWYQWTQELFCDAIGLAIGGPAFLHAFSAFLATLDPSDFRRERTELAGSSHPVTWLRIRLLSARAVAQGYQAEGRAIEEEWRTIAQSMSMQEEYYGFYDPVLDEPIRTAIDDMLVEAAPQACTAEEAAGGDWSQNSASPVGLLNAAWREYQADPSAYVEWEQRRMASLLAEPSPSA